MPERVFDLSDEVEKKRKQVTWVRFVGVVFVIAIWLMAFLVPKGGFPGLLRNLFSTDATHAIAGLILFAVIIPLSFFLLRVGMIDYAEGAGKLVIGDRAAEFHYRSGKVYLFSWTQPKTELLITMGYAALSDGRGNAEISGIWPDSWLSKDALDALTMAARDHGLQVRDETTRWNLRSPGDPWRTIRICGTAYAKRLAR